MSGHVSGKRAVVEALRAGGVNEVLLADGARDTEGLREVREAAATAGVPIKRVPREQLDRMAEDHRGVVANLSPATTSGRELSERDLSSFLFSDQAIVVILDGVSDPQNLGAAARAADSAGAEMLVTRVKRAAGVTDAAVRASAGALLTLPHARVANITKAIERLKDAGFTVAGLDAEAPGSIYGQPCPTGRLAVVVGSEGTGMSRLAREHCDVLVSLPMRGKVASLNAAASLAATLFAWVLPSRAVDSGGRPA